MSCMRMSAKHGQSWISYNHFQAKNQAKGLSFLP